MKSNRQLAKEAKAHGEKQFHGTPCGYCGGTLRWVSNGGGCVACHRVSSKYAQRTRRAREKARETAT